MRGEGSNLRYSELCMASPKPPPETTREGNVRLPRTGGFPAGRFYAATAGAVSASYVSLINNGTLRYSTSLQLPLVRRSL